MANNGIFYRKKIHNAQEVGATDSYNFVRLYREQDPQTGAITQVQEADLVFTTRQFNITPLFEGDKFGVCVKRVPNESIFILRFADRNNALRFFATIFQDANPRIPCSLNQNWIQEHVQYIDSPVPFNLPNLPYLDRPLF